MTVITGWVLLAPLATGHISPTPSSPCRWRQGMSRQEDGPERWLLTGGGLGGHISAVNRSQGSCHESYPSPSLLIFETGSGVAQALYLAQAGFNIQSSCFHLLSAGNASVCHPGWFKPCFRLNPALRSCQLSPPLTELHPQPLEQTAVTANGCGSMFLASR